MSTSTITTNSPIKFFSPREQAIFLACFLKAQANQTLPVCLSYQELSQISGLSVRETILAMMQLWLWGYLRGKLARDRQEAMNLEILTGSARHTAPENLPINGRAVSSEKVTNRQTNTNNEYNLLPNETNKKINIYNNTNTDTGEKNKEGGLEGEEGKEGQPLLLPSEPWHIAQYIASALGDEKNLGLYHAYAQTYRPETLQDALEAALAVPAFKIRKSRAAYFIYRLKHFRQGGPVIPERGSSQGKETSPSPEKPQQL